MNSSTTSALNRTSTIGTLKEKTFDLIVVGGGATGAGIALDAAERGLKIALVEKGDFASGTSSKSTKLIHGGLRYLKQLDIALVRETGTERAIVHRLAPHLVLPEKMLMPLIENGNYGYWSTSFGLWVYDVLANVKGDDRRKMLSKADALKQEPLLDASKLKGGGFYAEYRTDDARLTIELLKTASQKGALALNYTKAVDFIYNDENKVAGINVVDGLTGEQYAIKTRRVVSASGPWVDKLRKKDGSLSGKRLHLTKGVHLVFPHAKIPLKHTLYFDVPDGRMVFAIPRGKVTYVGTTDTEYTGDLNRVVATKDDAVYLLSAINHALPTVKVDKNDIISNWAGLRPLIHEDGKSPSELSRKDEIFVSDQGLISIAGGKLTGYRKMAQRIVDLVDEQLVEEYGPCQTKKVPLTPDPLKGAAAVENYIQEITNKVSQLKLDKYYGWYLVTAYGKQTEQILGKMGEFKNDTPDIALLRAEAWFGVHHEMVNRIDDLLVRRTGRLYFDIESIAPAMDIVLDDLANYLGWNPQRKQEERERMELLLTDATTYYETDMKAVAV